METILMVAVVLITLAVIAQAGVLLAMYMLSRRVTGKVEVLMDESQKLITPLESITANLKSVSDDLAETGQLARRQMLQIQNLVGDTREEIRLQFLHVRERVVDTVEEARETVMRPIRQYSAIASAIAEGVKTFFHSASEAKATTEIEAELEIDIRRENPAA
jgi:virulence-associated protein VagC